MTHNNLVLAQRKTKGSQPSHKKSSEAKLKSPFRRPKYFQITLRLWYFRLKHKNCVEIFALFKYLNVIRCIFPLYFCCKYSLRSSTWLLMCSDVLVCWSVDLYVFNLGLSYQLTPTKRFAACHLCIFASVSIALPIDSNLSGWIRRSCEFQYFTSSWLRRFW